MRINVIARACLFNKQGRGRGVKEEGLMVVWIDVIFVMRVCVCNRITDSSVMYLES